MQLTAIFYILLTTFLSGSQQPEDKMLGAWQTTTTEGHLGLLIVTDGHFSISYFTSSPAEFIGTRGGKWTRLNEDNLEVTWEYNTMDKSMVGETAEYPAELNGDELKGGEHSWTRLDKGGPGKLAGAWVITGRKQGDDMQKMTPGARKTMKILSGTRFQWIAYNSETGEFSGTGGGTYTTDGGKYTEHIQFFSRDNNRVGASLEFDYSLENGQWHHSGLSSKGDPIYEVWTKRSELGI
jgi:hypothetical protein